MKSIVSTAATLALFVGGTAWASHPEPGQMDRVQRLAHDLERAARHVHKDAERRAHHGDYLEEKALRRLHHLEDRARHFHHQAEKYYQNPYHTEKDFEKLVRAFHAAERSLHDLHAYDHIYRDFYRVEVLMEKLLYYYGDGRYDRHGRYGRHDRHDRGYGHYDDDDHYHWKDIWYRFARPRR